jgi:3-oxoacyl-[acyl-carrier protein] reductase
VEYGMELKFHGARRLTIRAWDALRESKGAVVLISGNAAVIPKAGAAAVGAINAAIEALAKAFAERGIEDGVQVKSVSPGAIMTGRRLSMLEKAAASEKITFEEAKQQFLKQAGISRFGEAEEIADVLAFVVSPAARWMTGTVLRIDGGEVKSVCRVEENRLSSAGHQIVVYGGKGDGRATREKDPGTTELRSVPFTPGKVWAALQGAPLP